MPGYFDHRQFIQDRGRRALKGGFNSRVNLRKQLFLFMHSMGATGTCVP